MVRQRTKACDRCKEVAPVLYRVRLEPDQPWQFVCPNCWPQVSQGNPDYTYGGTWKGKK
jgi:hypothetical protein